MLSRTLLQLPPTFSLSQPSPSATLLPQILFLKSCIHRLSAVQSGATPIQLASHRPPPFRADGRLNAARLFPASAIASLYRSNRVLSGFSSCWLSLGSPSSFTESFFSPSGLGD